MPRIRIRTSEGERTVGTSNCSQLTIQLVAHAQRHTLQLRADAKLMAGNNVLEHLSWEWPELPDKTSIELISEPATTPYATYDPADVIHSVATQPQADNDPGQIAEQAYLDAERELRAAMEQLGAPPVPPGNHRPASRLASGTGLIHCSFCGKSQEEVYKLVAGPAVFICDECVQIASNVLTD